MYKNITIAVGITILFLGLAIQPSIATAQPDNIDAEPKDYLFQTIIDIANNPEVNELLEQYDNDMFKVDIDRSVNRKVLFRNPRVFRSLIFTKPSMSVEYLNKCYNNGIEVTNVLGEEKALEMMKSIGVTNPKVLDELNNIIINDEKLSGRLVILEEMNKELNSIDYPIICGILLIVTLGAMVPITIGLAFLQFLFYSYIFFRDILKLNGIPKLILQMTAILLYIGFILFVLTSNFCILMVSP